MNQITIKKCEQTKNGTVCFPEAIHAIDNDNWNYPADVKARFGITYDEAHFYLRYEVDELHPKAVSTNTNGPVWEDSCVEFFIAFNDGNYYNLEFNCIGTRLAGAGACKADRRRLSPEVVESIVTHPSLGSQVIDKEDTPTSWSMDIIIPISIFGDSVEQLAAGQSYRANFYKCGDKQKEMHFLSWNPIANETPNFHLPEHFGLIKLT
ncbi:MULTISPECIES: carbohydrate-binding family 9-like protein [unclassified Carboxylicivirga]|uniref:carbohydrate-binding family 9-like protein n=1 Tax=Carboxylicivirga TaxID=1628153 RepID=UPI003D32DFB6